MWNRIFDAVLWATFALELLIMSWILAFFTAISDYGLPNTSVPHWAYWLATHWLAVLGWFIRLFWKRF